MEEEEVDRRIGENTISVGGEAWKLPTQLEQLKIEQDGNVVVAKSSVVPRRLAGLWDRLN